MSLIICIIGKMSFSISICYNKPVSSLYNGMIANRIKGMIGKKKRGINAKELICKYNEVDHAVYLRQFQICVFFYDCMDYVVAGVG